ncbi:ribosome recycling factor [Candidatus Hodgkinia cicadicola]
MNQFGNELVSEELRKAVACFKRKAGLYFVDRTSFEMVSHLKLGSSSLGSSCSFNQLSDGSVELSFFERANAKSAVRAITSSKLGLCPKARNGSVYIPLPAVTSARRSAVLASLFELKEQFKAGVRNARRRAVSDLKAVKRISCDFRRSRLKLIDDVSAKALADLEEVYELNQRRLSFS